MIVLLSQRRKGGVSRDLIDLRKFKRSGRRVVVLGDGNWQLATDAGMVVHLALGVVDSSGSNTPTGQPGNRARFGRSAGL